MRVIITGSCGNVATELIKYLDDKGYITLGIDSQQGWRQGFKTVDINNAADVYDTFKWFKPQVCYHLAAMVSRVTCEVAPSTTAQTNLLGTLNIIQACKAFDVRMINFSTSEVYGNVGGVLREDMVCKPNNFYGLTKLLAEQLVEYHARWGLNACTVRPFMFYHENETMGDHRSAMVRWVTALLKGEKITVHEGAVRGWLHLDDGAAILEKLAGSTGYFVMNAGSPEVIEMWALAQMICGQLGLDWQQWVRVKELPQQMTLTKIPDLSLQMALTGYSEFLVPLAVGVKRMINKLKTRI